MHRDILENLLEKVHKSEDQTKTLNDFYDAYINEIEQRNIENVDHFKQICSHEQEIL